MTRDEIEAMPKAELNMQIAAKVMGLELEEGRGMLGKISSETAKMLGFPMTDYEKPNLVVKDDRALTGQREIPKYSNDISEAMKVVEMMGDKGWMLYKLAHTTDQYSKIIGYECIFHNIATGASREVKSYSAARAIAIAALSAMEASHE